MYAGAEPPSVHACEQRSICISSPYVVFVSSSDDVVAVVASVIDARLIEPVFDRSTLRWIVSPGATPVASTLSRFVLAPVEPSAIVTLPVEMLWETLSVLVQVPKAPALAAAAAITKSANPARRRPRGVETSRACSRSRLRGEGL